MLLEKTHVTLLGSHAESCKVRDPNGFDFMFYLSSLAETSAPSYSPNDTAGYFKFEFKYGKGSELVKDPLKRDIGNISSLRESKYVSSAWLVVFLLNMVEV